MKILATLAFFLVTASFSFVGSVKGFSIPPERPERPEIPERPDLTTLHYYSHGQVNTNVSGSSIYGGSLSEMAYGGSRYAVVFDDNRDGNNEIYLTLLTQTGKKLGDDLRITDDPGASWNPTVAWNGRTFGIFWYDSIGTDPRGIYYAAVSCRGEVEVAPTRINPLASDGVHPSAVWNPKTREYGVVWWDSRVGGTYFARVDREGNVVVETPVSTLGPSGYYRPIIGHNKKEFVTLWEEWVPCPSGLCPEMAFARVDKNGVKIGVDEVITAYGATRAKSVAWNGSEWGILAGFGHYAKLLRVSTTGDILEPPIPLDLIPMSNARMIWTGREYAVTYIDTHGYLRTFDRNGSPTRDPIQVSETTGPNWNSSPPVQAGRNIAVVWVDKLYEPDQAIYFGQSRLK